MSGIIDSYIPVAIFLVVALVMPPMTMFMVKQLSPRSKAAGKYTTYESGSVPTGTARIQFNVEYYLYAIAFVLFDVEVLFLARKLNYRVREVPVRWFHVSGSKVNPVKDSLRMIGDITKVRLNDMRGLYK